MCFNGVTGGSRCLKSPIEGGGGYSLDKISSFCSG